MRSLKSWLVVALIVVPTAYIFNFIYAVNTNQSGGTFGDTFGAANALFSGTALMALVYAIILQREELAIVREERNDTRRLLEGQEELNELQKHALDRQVFEQSFSSVLSTAQYEKERLAVKPVIDGKENSSKYFNSALFSERLLTAFQKGEDPFSDQNLGTRKLASENDVNNSLLVHLNQLIKVSCSDEFRASSLKQLLKSFTDEEVAHCIAWKIFQDIRDNAVDHAWIEFFETYELSNTLTEKSKEAFLSKYSPYCEASISSSIAPCSSSLPSSARIP